jgi:hypothetical protein
VARARVKDLDLEIRAREHGSVLWRLRPVDFDLLACA